MVVVALVVMASPSYQILTELLQINEFLTWSHVNLVLTDALWNNSASAIKVIKLNLINLNLIRWRVRYWLWNFCFTVLLLLFLIKVRWEHVGFCLFQQQQQRSLPPQTPPRPPSTVSSPIYYSVQPTNVYPLVTPAPNAQPSRNTMVQNKRGTSTQRQRYSFPQDHHGKLSNCFLRFWSKYVASFSLGKPVHVWSYLYSSVRMNEF